MTQFPQPGEIPAQETRSFRFWRAVGGRKVAFCLVFLVAGTVLAIKGALDWPAVTLLVGLYTSLAGANAANTIASLRAGVGAQPGPMA